MLSSTTLIAGSIGTFIGVLMGLTGAGGGILSVPLLTLVFHLQVAEASHIALMTIAASATLGAAEGLRRGELRYRAALLIALFGALLSPLGVWLSRLLPNSILVLLFSSVLVYVAVRMLIRARGWCGTDQPPQKPPPCRLDQSIGRLIWTRPCARALAGSGAVTGFLSGLLGVGGGFIVVPALQKHTDLPIASAIATSLGVLALVSSAGFVSAAVHGPILWVIALPFATGALAGVLIGGRIKYRISENRIRETFALLAFCVAIGFAFKSLAQPRLAY